MRLELLFLSVMFVPSVLTAQAVVNQWPHTGLFAGGVAYDPIDDSIWVFDESADTITQYSRAGVLITSLVAPIVVAGNAQPIGGFVDPTTGNLWVGDEGMFVYEMDRAGTVLRSWTTQPAVTDVSAVTYDPCTDTLWVSNDSAQFLQEFDKNGTALAMISVAAAGSTDPDGCCYNPVTRTFFLGDDTANKIIEVDRTGAFVNSWSTAPVSPEGLSIDTRTGSLFVANGFVIPTDIFEYSGIVTPAAAGAITTFGTGCIDSGGGTPSIALSHPARVGSGFSVAEHTMITAAGVNAYFNLDVTRQNFSLAFLGSPCTAYAFSTLATLTVPISSNGYAGFTLCVPNNPSLAGAKLIGFALNFPEAVPGSVSGTGGIEFTIQP